MIDLSELSKIIVSDHRKKEKIQAVFQYCRCYREGTCAYEMQ